jgi:molybdate transport system ATP-binding protein
LSSPAPHHHFEADLRTGPFHLDVAFDLTAPWTVLFGSSGSGKSTVLRAMSGLFTKASINFARIGRSGSLELQGKHHTTPPQKRNLAYAPQGSSLFPHLTVLRNISFATDISHRPSPRTIEEILTLFDLDPLANRMPRDLSGGERQRVNLARAFAVPQPTLFLLDEPFSGVDRAMRDTLLSRMQQHVAQLGVPVLSVTHDVEEALLLNAEVIRIEQGSVKDQGPAPRVLAEERAASLEVFSR